MAGNAAAEAKTPYKIGAILPLTGYLSWVGEYKKKGAELKVELINKAGGVGGHPLELIIYDDQSSPEVAGRHAQRLISKDGVVAISAGSSVPLSGVVASIANKAKIPTIVHSGYAITDKDLYVFNTAHKTDFALSRAMEWLQKKGLTRLALLMPIGPLGELGSSVANKYGPTYKMTIVGEEKFDVKAPDLTAQLAKIKTLNPQAIMSFSTGEPAALIARNMAQMGINVPLVVSHGNANAGFLKLVSQTPETIVVPSGKSMAPESLPDSDPTKKVILEFNKAHIAKYGEPAAAVEMVDSISLIAEGLRVTGSDDPVKLRDAIEKIQGFVGLQGVYRMSPTDHYGTRTEDMILITVKDGKWQVLQ
jgi:branched-chain amino acid transport system substrate-binding protein